ncbi:MAG: hypothetical protein P8Y71_17200 [Pseudolabrys sp.]
MARVTFGLGAAALAGLFLMSVPAAAQGSQRERRENVAQSRPRIVIHPRHYKPGPNAKRHCRFWLAKQIWPNGQPVITPQMRCWWQ